MVFGLQTSANYSYPLEVIKEEVRYLLQTQKISRHQPIYILCQYIPAREWLQVESELALSDYLLRDSIGDLVSMESWSND